MLMGQQRRWEWLIERAATLPARAIDQVLCILCEGRDGVRHPGFRTIPDKRRHWPSETDDRFSSSNGDDLNPTTFLLTALV